MSNTTAGSHAAAPAGSPSAGTSGGGTREVRRFTETKAGPKTTEFMLTVLFIAGVLVAAYWTNEDALNRDEGWRYAALVAGAYIISRGLAKLGVREPYSDETGR